VKKTTIIIVCGLCLLAATSWAAESSNDLDNIAKICEYIGVAEGCGFDMTKEKDFVLRLPSRFVGGAAPLGAQNGRCQGTMKVSFILGRMGKVECAGSHEKVLTALKAYE